MRAIGKAGLSLVHQAQIGFVNERGRLQSVIRLLARHVTVSKASKFFVNERSQLFQSGFLSLAPIGQ
ncbi:MAG: hypothetical protein AUG74_10970 [Bacteroidetes bacterium 13_1_20CM_4_60_6]|nr:MAG: hypothetical protein AUG74_10970 [Bacteroidetes bacterium 13_1_20CM_4_60_6]